MFELKDLQQRLNELDKRLDHLNTQHEDTRRLLTLPGVGPLGASALIITLGDGKDFKNGCHFASYLRLVPKEHSSGGKVRQLGVSKRGDAYLRGILIHDARSFVYRLNKRPDEQCNELQRWLKGLIERSGINKAVVALANKNARIAWALVNQQSVYIP
ncbi:transposase [Xenorhabdus vietnamensis]|uniref:Transposase n=1 Tax=Xenorhabdus vietnamensis TaxID=351656 RepID=A0A1Y2SB88_9GAMM|nr:IS110 family transposase [Xenorhabdus vietnamensis]OTA14782.1 transposase [Xenorhabdus vietnamensis]